MTKKVFGGIVLFALASALVLRTARLDLRPMHHDEANQAVKFGNLLEQGEYRYDPKDHHGPSLYYLTLPLARLAGRTTLASLDETVIRLVPALFGAGIILLLLLLSGGMSREGTLLSGLLIAVSPAFVFYGRFYIQETLLVFFLAGAVAAGWRAIRTGALLWAAAAGFFCGMMYATKETSLVLFGTAAAAWALTCLGPGKSLLKKEAFRRPGLLGVAVFLAAAAIPIVLFFSSFFKNPAGIRDSFLALTTYFGRAGGAGLHTHPWYYYMQILTYSHAGTGPMWSEAFILALALAGSFSAFGTDPGKDASPGFIRFVFFFTVLTAGVYSAIPYKTPWNLLPFHFGIILLAGNGAALIWKAGRFILIKALALFILLPGMINLGYQAYQGNFVHYADPANPYVYAQTIPDYNKLVRRIEEVAGIHADRQGMLIKVIARPDEMWPLPWSLRRFTQVGYWREAADAGDLGGTPIIIASMDQAGRIQAAVGEGFQVEHYGLRPEVMLAFYIRQDLWLRLMESRGVR